MLEVGAVVDGRYELLQLLGVGGTGTVYEALDLQLGRSVALKVIELQQNQRKALQHEARCLSLVRHDNILTVLSIGFLSESLAYLVTEFVSGKTLAAVLAEEGSLQPERALSICVQLAEALSVLHKSSIIHRDLKPQNIMLASTADREVVKLIDLGLARCLETGSNTTASGLLIGTPQYMSPEQCMGHRADERSDLYAFGCVLCEMLTGKPPFTADVAIAYLHHHCNDQVKLSPGKHLRQSGLWNDFEALTLKCLEKAPALRFQSADELLHALRCLQNGEQINLPRPAVRFSGGRRLLVAMFVCSFVVCTAAVCLPAAHSPLKSSGLDELPRNSRVSRMGLGPQASVDSALYYIKKLGEARYYGVSRKEQCEIEKNIRTWLEANQASKGQTPQYFEILTRLIKPVESLHGMIAAHSLSRKSLELYLSLSPEQQRRLSGHCIRTFMQQLSNFVPPEGLDRVMLQEFDDWGPKEQILVREMQYHFCNANGKLKEFLPLMKATVDKISSDPMILDDYRCLAYATYARTLSRLSKWNEAAKFFEMALELSDPQSRDVRSQFADTVARTGSAKFMIRRVTADHVTPNEHRLQPHLLELELAAALAYQKDFARAARLARHVRASAVSDETAADAQALLLVIIQFQNLGFAASKASMLEFVKEVDNKTLVSGVTARLQNTLKQQGLLSPPQWRELDREFQKYESAKPDLYRALSILHATNLPAGDLGYEDWKRISEKMDHGNPSPDTRLLVNSTLARVLLAMHKPAEAKYYLEQEEEVPASASNEDLKFRHSYVTGLYYAQTKQRDRAIQQFRKLLSAAREDIARTGVVHISDYFGCAQALAKEYTADRHRDLALNCLEETWKSVEQIDFSNVASHGYLEGLLTQLKELYLSGGQDVEARKIDRVLNKLKRDSARLGF